MYIIFFIQDCFSKTFVEKFYKKESILVFAVPNKLALISCADNPTPNDKKLLKNIGIQYNDISWFVNIKTSEWKQKNGVWKRSYLH